MRGEHVVVGDSELALYGIIPACAGSTPLVYEYKGDKRGSSPHARGAR